MKVNISADTHRMTCVIKIYYHSKIRNTPLSVSKQPKFWCNYYVYFSQVRIQEFAKGWGQLLRPKVVDLVKQSCASGAFFHFLTSRNCFVNFPTKKGKGFYLSPNPILSQHTVGKFYLAFHRRNH